MLRLYTAELLKTGLVKISYFFSRNLKFGFNILTPGNIILHHQFFPILATIEPNGIQTASKLPKTSFAIRKRTNFYTKSRACAQTNISRQANLARLSCRSRRKRAVQKKGLLSLPFCILSTLEKTLKKAKILIDPVFKNPCSLQTWPRTPGIYLILKLY